jgi:hypothetical protein
MSATVAGVAAADPSAPVPERSGTTDAPEERHFWLWLAVIVAVGLAVRLFYAIHYKWDQPVGGDAFYYHWQARLLVDGHWFVGPYEFKAFGRLRPNAEHPPLYTLFLSIPTVLGFVSFRAHMLASCLLGTATVGVVGIAGRRIAGARVGLVAAALAAVYAHLWFNDGLVVSETIAQLLVALVVLTAYRFWQDPSLRKAVWLGVACGFAALTRAELVFYIPIVVIPLALMVRGLATRKRLERLGAIVVVAAIPVLGWVTYNYVRLDSPVFSTGGDYTLANANCDSTYYGDRLGYWDLTCMRNRWKIPGNDAEVARAFRQDGLDYIGNHLARLPVVLAARVGLMWDVYNPIQKLRWDAYEQGRGPTNLTRIGLAQYYVLALLAIAGLVMLRRRRVLILPLIGLLITSTLAAMLALGATRYRSPAEIAIVLAGAVPLAALWDRWRPAGRRAPQGGASDVAGAAEPASKGGA